MNQKLKNLKLTAWPEVVCYHDNCTDGIAAAAVVYNAIGYNEWVGHSKLAYPDFVPVQYGNPLPERVLAGGRSLLFVDWCPEREQIPLLGGWTEWVAIDHHAHRSWLPTEFPEHAIFALDQSGAVLTYRAIYPHAEIPDLLRYVQDRDLWTWALPNSREVSAALGEEPKDVVHWSSMLDNDDLEVDSVGAITAMSRLVARGSILLLSRTRQAKGLAAKAVCLTAALNSVDLWTVNATENVSEVGEEILRLHPGAVACSWFSVGPGEVVLSFRSDGTGRETALSFARANGGGGHERAAGAKICHSEWAARLKGAI